MYTQNDQKLQKFSERQNNEVNLMKLFQPNFMAESFFGQI
jgi:hypothetical protein